MAGISPFGPEGRGSRAGVVVVRWVEVDLRLSHDGRRFAEADGRRSVDGEVGVSPSVGGCVALEA